MSDCIFCKIVKGEIPCYKIAETENVLAFLDVMPISRGHLLVIPKKHVELIYDADPEIMAEVMSTAVKISATAKKVLKCDGMNLLLNTEKCAGQIVPHVHLHLIPRYSNDSINWPWPQGSLDENSAAQLVENLKRIMD